MIIIVIRVVRTVGSGRATPLNVPTALRVSFLAPHIHYILVSDLNVLEGELYTVLRGATLYPLNISLGT